MSELSITLPILDFAKDSRVGCSACGQTAPFTLRRFESGPTVVGWQLRLIGTEVMIEEGMARSWRWDLFCPACAGEKSPRPPDSVRLRFRAGDA